MNRILFLAVTLGMAAIASADTAYDAKADFSAKNNPNGPWRYGWSNELNGEMTVYPKVYEVRGAHCWTDSSIEIDGGPHVGCLSRPLPDVNEPETTMQMHPGPELQFSRCEWTAPASGIYDIEIKIRGVDIGGPHAYVLHNGKSVKDAELKQNDVLAVSLNALRLKKGETIDAVVGGGASGIFNNDEVAFTFSVKEGKEAKDPKPPITFSIRRTSRNVPHAA